MSGLLLPVTTRRNTSSSRTESLVAVDRHARRAEAQLMGAGQRRERGVETREAVGRRRGPGPLQELRRRRTVTGLQDRLRLAPAEVRRVVREPDRREGVGGAVCTVDDPFSPQAADLGIDADRVRVEERSWPPELRNGGLPGRDD